jgi:hypothetical protein
VTPWLLRVPLTVMVLALMTLTAIGSYGFLTRAHLQHQVAARSWKARAAVSRGPATAAGTGAARLKALKWRGFRVYSGHAERRR